MVDRVLPTVRYVSVEGPVTRMIPGTGGGKGAPMAVFGYGAGLNFAVRPAADLAGPSPQLTSAFYLIP